MKLRQYAIELRLKAPQIKDELQLGSLNTVYRYLREEQIPERAIMRKIYVWSRGAVQPNDFYDLPDLSILSAEQAA